MRSTYRTEDVTILLKDISGMVEPMSTEEREKRIQKGTHYCEMLPIEYKPTIPYMNAYEIAQKSYAKETARAAAIVSEKILKEKGKNLVLVSLARAGISAGILIKHYLWNKYKLKVPHYAISIIRGRGIDHNAMKYLLDRYPPESIQFVDGWTGKGAILNVLKEEMKLYQGVSNKLAVLADPAGITEICGTHEDILIASSCLNSTISGLISRTFLRDDIIKPEDFHGAVFYEEWKAEDMTYDFIDTIEKCFDYADWDGTEYKMEKSGSEQVQEIREHYQISDLNFIKPGIGETTRVLLRRVPWKVLIHKDYREDPALLHIYRLAAEKQVEIDYYPLSNYKACGIIKKCADI